MTNTLYLTKWLRTLAGGMLTLTLLACASQPNAPQAVGLEPDPALLGVHLAWSAQVAPVTSPLQLAVSGHTLFIAHGDATVTARAADTGAVLWQASVGAPIVAGVGSDGKWVSVVTRHNELVTLENGRERWRVRVPAQVLTAPLVAGARVFVLAGDRSVSAFDAKTGLKLWSEQHPGDTLVLRQAGVLNAFNNTLLVGLAGRLVGLDPINGQTRWSATIASPRGVNDVERLVDLIDGVGRRNALVCARAFQAAVGCVDAEQGLVRWRQTSVGAVGLHSDAEKLYGAEADGRVIAWKITDGQVAWSSDALRYHQLSAPLVLGRSVVVGDETGRLHFLSREDGSILKRLDTDGSAVATKPTLVGNTLVVMTRKGGVFGFQPD